MQRDAKGRFVSSKKETVYAKGFKGFDREMRCMDKQYAENAVFEEPKADLCVCGMHFCENPVDVLRYYSLLDRCADPAPIARVESLAEPIKGDGKSVTTKLRIGNKLSLGEYGLEAINSMASDDNKNSNTVFEEDAQQHARAYQTGDHRGQAQAGDEAFQIQSGVECRQAQSGYLITQMQLECYCVQAQAGDCTQQVQTAERCFQAQAGGAARQCQLGDCSLQTQSGRGCAQTQYGVNSRQASVGDSCSAAAYSEDSLVAALGRYSKVKGALGCLLILVDYKRSDVYPYYAPYKVLWAVVDGVKIKADTWYTVVNGELAECTFPTEEKE